MEKFSCLFIFLFIAMPGYSQQDSLGIEPKLSVGLSYNTYRGDLGEGYQSGGLALQLSYIFGHEKRLHGGIHAAVGSFSGYELRSEPLDFTTEVFPNNYFKANFISVHYSLQYDIFRRANWLVYIRQGLGIMRFVPRDEQGNSLTDALETRADNESYGNATAILPTQAGVDYYLPNRLGLGLKLGWLNTTTDYLDNISLLGRRSGNDNIFQLILQLHLPL